MAWPPANHQDVTDRINSESRRLTTTESVATDADTKATAAQARADAAHTLATGAYTRPVSGAELDFLSTAAQDKILGVPTAVRTANYTLTAADVGVLQVFDTPGPVSLFVPADLPGTTGAGRVYPFLQLGAGAVTVRSATTGGTISVRGSSSYVGSTFATAHNIVMPAGIFAGDGLAVLLALASTAKTVTPPSDFTLRGTVIGPSGAGQYLFTKSNAAAADAGATKTWSFDTTSPAVAVVVDLAGAHLTDFLDGMAPVGPDTQNDSSADPYTTGAAGCLELSLRAVSTGLTQAAAIAAAPTGLTMLQSVATTATDANTQCAAARGAGPVPAGTLIGERQWASGYGSTRTVAVKPAATEAVKVRADDNAFTSAGPGSFGDVLVIPQGVFVTGRLIP